MTGQEQDPDPGPFCAFQRFAEGRIGFLVSPHFHDPVHLNDKQQDGSAFRRVRQFAQMLCTPFSRRVRKVSDPVPLQGTAFDLHQEPFAAPFHHEIQPGLPVCVFRPDHVKALRFQPLPGHGVGSLAVDVDQQAV